MSECDPERVLADLEYRARELGIPLSLETREQILRNLQQEADYHARPQVSQSQPIVEESGMCCASADTPVRPVPVIGEAGTVERAESGPEKRDRDLFALRHTDRTGRPEHRSGDAERRYGAEERLRRL